jgi:hypothetical protein
MTFSFMALDQFQSIRGWKNVPQSQLKFICKKSRGNFSTIVMLSSFRPFITRADSLRSDSPNCLKMPVLPPSSLYHPPSLTGFRSEE